MGEIIYLNKQAGFVEDALRTIKDKTHLFDRPFETIFGAMLPMIIWPRSKMLGALFFVAEVLGYGGSNLGKLIDRAVGFGTSGKPNLSDESLKGAATGVIDKILAKLGIKAESMAKDLCEIKQSIEIHDLVTIAAYVKQNPNIKVAYPGRTRFLRRFLMKTSRGGRLGLINGLWWVLKTFAKGLVGLGIAGGIAGTVGLKPSGKPGVAPGEGGGLEKLFPPSRESKPLLMREQKTDLYLNTQNNVEATLIHFLDAQYKIKFKDKGKYMTFSQMFKELNGYPLKGSGEMRDILKLVEGLSWGELEQIDNKRTFVGPKLEAIAKKLLPVMKLESGVTEIDKDLAHALRGVYK